MNQYGCRKVCRCVRSVFSLDQPDRLIILFAQISLVQASSSCPGLIHSVETERAHCFVWHSNVDLKFSWFRVISVAYAIYITVAFTC